MDLNDIKAMLPSKKIPSKGLTDEIIGEAIISYANQLANKISDVQLNFVSESDECLELERLKNTFTAFRWAYPIKLKSFSIDCCDRTKPMITGPLFTSCEFPWPEKDDRFREPVAQFYIDEVGELAGENLGSGLFQLWVGPQYDDYCIRLIPRDLVSKDALEPVPSVIDDDYFEKSDFYAGFGAWPEKGSKAHHIMGLKSKVLHWDDLIHLVAEDVSTLEALSPELFAEVSSFTALLPSNLPFTAPHFLGNFSTIQYDSSMMPKTLLALESKPAFMWGDCGNAQVFYSTVEGEAVEFSFQWSCG